MKTFGTLLLGALLGSVITWALLRDEPSPVTPSPVVATTEAVHDAGVELVIATPKKIHPKLAVATGQSPRQREVAQRASELTGCGSSLTVMTIATAQLAIANDGAVRPKRLQLEPASEAATECLREKLAALHVSKADAPEEMLVRLRFEPE